MGIDLANLRKTTTPSPVKLSIVCILPELY